MSQHPEAAAWSPAGGILATTNDDGITVHTTPPKLSLVAPANGTTYAQGADVKASYFCADGIARVRPRVVYRPGRLRSGDRHGDAG